MLRTSAFENSPPRELAEEQKLGHTSLLPSPYPFLFPFPPFLFCAHILHCSCRTTHISEMTTGCQLRIIFCFDSAFLSIHSSVRFCVFFSVPFGGTLH